MTEGGEKDDARRKDRNDRHGRAEQSRVAVCPGV